MFRIENLKEGNDSVLAGHSKQAAHARQDNVRTGQHVTLKAVSLGQMKGVATSCWGSKIYQVTNGEVLDLGEAKVKSGV